MTGNGPETHKSSRNMKVTKGEMTQSNVKYPKTVQNNRSYTRNAQKHRGMGQKCATMTN